MSIKSSRDVLKVEGAQGGAGHILKDLLISDEQCGEHCKMFAEIVLEPGCEVGYHAHIGDTETYYIVEGEGIYNDNGEVIKVKAGDVTFCDEGQSHGLINDGDVNLRMVALILKK